MIEQIFVVAVAAIGLVFAVSLAAIFAMGAYILWREIYNDES